MAVKHAKMQSVRERKWGELTRKLVFLAVLGLNLTKTKNGRIKLNTQSQGISREVRQLSPRRKKKQKEIGHTSFTLFILSWYIFAYGHSYIHGI